MYDDLKGKTCLITGAGKKSGIGYAIAEKMARCGSNVVIADLGKLAQNDSPVKLGTTEEMEEIVADLKRDFGVGALAVELDVTSNPSIEAALEKTNAAFGGLDVLYNNAGAAFGSPSAINDYDEAAWLKTIDVNLHGVFRMSKAAVKLMKGKGGAIVNLASKAGKSPPLWNGAYGVAKAGVIMLTKVMALELGLENIRVNALCPGLIMTDLQVYRLEMEAAVFNSTFEEREKALAQSVPMGRLGSASEVADLAVFLASNSSSYITGQAFNIGGGILMEA